MRRSSLACPLFAALALAACEKAAPPPPEPDPAPPAALLAYAELPSATDLSALAEAVSQIAPEAGPMVATALPMQLGQMMGAHLSSTDAVDLGGPLRVLVLDPEAHPDPLVFLVRARGEVEAAKGSAVVRISDQAVFGAPEAVAAVDGFAAHLATVAVAEPKVVAFPGHLWAAYRDEVAKLPELVSQAPAAETGGIDFEEIAAIYIELIEALAVDGETAILTVSSQPGAAHFELEVAARAGSALAAFVAAQEPAPFTAHQRLPAVADATIYADWTLHAGPALPAMLRFGKRMVGATMGDDAEAMEQWIRRYADVLAGDGAMAMRFELRPDTAMPAPQVVAAYGVTDEARARQALLDVMPLWSGKREVFGVATTSEFTAEAATHAGVPIMRQRSITSMPGASGAPVEVEQVAHMAVAGGDIVYALGAGGEELVRGAIDGVARGAPSFQPGASLARVIEHARGGKASALMYMDMSAMVPPGAGPVPTFAMTVAFSERAMTFTMSFLR